MNGLIITLIQRILTGEAEVKAKIITCDMEDLEKLICTMPGVKKMLAMRIITEMGAN